MALRLIVALVIVAGSLWIGLDAAMKTAGAPVAGLLWQGLGVDIHNRRPNLARDLHKFIGRHGGIDDLERCGVGTVDLLLLSPGPMSDK